RGGTVMPDARRKEREAARRAARRAEADAWRAQVDRHFASLRTTYGFRLTRADASSAWVTSVVYQSDVAAVRVDRSIEFNRVELSVLRLVRGRLPREPTHPIFITPETVINETGFDTILQLRRPQLLEQRHDLRGLDNEHIERSLAFLARTLEEIAPDVLAGDLSLFVAVDEHIKAGIKAHPPTVTVYLPEDATPEREAAAIEEAYKLGPGVQQV